VLRFEPLYIPRLGDLETGVLQRFDKLKHPGVLPIEAVLPTDLFKQNMQEREIEINSFLRFL
jgi:hypothetical protein